MLQNKIKKKHVTRSLLLLHWLDVVPADVEDKVEVCGRIDDDPDVETDVTDVVTGCTIEDEED